MVILCMYVTVDTSLENAVVAIERALLEAQAHVAEIRGNEKVLKARSPQVRPSALPEYKAPPKRDLSALSVRSPDELKAAGVFFASAATTAGTRGL